MSIQIRNLNFFKKNNSLSYIYLYSYSDIRYNILEFYVLNMNKIWLTIRQGNDNFAKISWLSPVEYFFKHWNDILSTNWNWKSAVAIHIPYPKNEDSTKACLITYKKPVRCLKNQIHAGLQNQSTDKNVMERNRL